MNLYVISVMSNKLHNKLELLKEGKVATPTPEDLQKKESMRVKADEEGAAAKASQTDVVQVDAKEEAAKEQASSAMDTE